MMKKHCPFKFNSNTLDVDGEFHSESCICEKNRCAFWDENLGMCAIKGISWIRSMEVVRSEENEEVDDE